MVEPIIQIQGLDKYYGDRPGVVGIDLEVQPGEIFGFLGPNGAGKTTLIRTMLDLLHPSRGQIRIFGLDSRREASRIHQDLGNLPGEFAYWEKSTGRQVLSLFSQIRGPGDPDWTQSLTNRLQADLDQPLGSLSRGNRQKVALILALAKQPRLLLLDEPTSGLDPLMQVEFMQIIREMHQAGTSIFLSSHDLAEVEQVCHRVGIVRQGKLVAVEEVSQMRSRSDHRIIVRLSQAEELARLQALPGVHEWQAQDQGAAFHFSGDLAPLIHLLDGLQLLDLQVTKPSLEEMFLAYYGAGG